MSTSPKIAVLGVDCLEPSLVFDIWRKELPTFHQLLQVGSYGPMKSTIPPITVPAWMSMMTGKSPGELGIYGFRNRMVNGYEMDMVHSRKIHDKTIWDYAGAQGKQSIVLGVPLTYPVRPIRGNLVSCFLTPDTKAAFTYPTQLKQEILSKIPNYGFDVKHFRSTQYDSLIQDISNYTTQQYELASWLMSEKPWDLFVMVEMGTDRIQHAFWHFMDTGHVLYESNEQYRDVIKRHYQLVDRHLSRLIEQIPDNTVILIVSDHGAKRMDGGFCINQWLMDEGYLVLKEPVKEVTPFSKLKVDWNRTSAYADGGYYGRLFLNVKERQPQGIVPAEAANALLSELKDKLEKLHLPNGAPMNNTVFNPYDIYPKCRNTAPDGLIYFSDLYWRSIGSVGHEGWFIDYNDSGPDGANHSQYGTLIGVEKKGGVLKHISHMSQGYIEHLSIYDICPTVLDLLRIEPDEPMNGRALFSEICRS